MFFFSVTLSYCEQDLSHLIIELTRPQVFFIIDTNISSGKARLYSAHKYQSIMHLCCHFCRFQRHTITVSAKKKIMVGRLIDMGVVLQEGGIFREKVSTTTNQKTWSTALPLPKSYVPFLPGTLKVFTVVPSHVTKQRSLQHFLHVCVNVIP